MGFIDGLKNGAKKVVGIEDYDDDEILTEEEISNAKANIVKELPEETVKQKDNNLYSSYDNSKKEQDKRSHNMSRSFSSNGTTNLKLIVIEPRNFEEASKLVDNLKSKKPIIVNLEKLETETAKQIFDFLSGAIYALEGSVTKVTSNIFIFTPSNVRVTESKDDREVPKKKDDTNPWS